MHAPIAAPNLVHWRSGMRDPRPARDPQRGNSLLLALIVMSSLATLGSLTVVSVQSSLKASTNDRSQAIATYAAESGGAATMDFLRNNFDPTTAWSAFVAAAGAPRTLTALPSHNKPPGDPANPLSPDLNAFYTVEILNNPTDPNFAAASDGDAIVIIRATGHGPQGSIAIVEWEVQRVAPAVVLPTPAPTDPVPPPPPASSWNPPPPATKALHIRSWRLVL